MSRQLADMTWPAVAEAVAAGRATVILPLGATEQHGPHLPLGTDTLRATALAERLASTLPDALVAPALPIGCSDEHSGFPGLLSLDHATLATVIVDCARRMVEWGARRLVLLSAHGGNAQALLLAAERLQQTCPDLQVWMPAELTEMPPALLAIAEADGLSPEAVGLHAGEGETSEMLRLRPDLVRQDQAAAGYVGAMPAILPTLQAAGLRAVTANGVLGDPRPAAAARGERYLAAQVEELRRDIAGSDAAGRQRERR